MNRQSQHLRKTLQCFSVGFPFSSFSSVHLLSCGKICFPLVLSILVHSRQYLFFPLPHPFWSKATLFQGIDLTSTSSTRLYSLSSQRSARCCSSCRNACFSISFLNSPCLLPSSSVCWPHSAICRWSSTATAWAFWMVERRWAMITTVLPVVWVRAAGNHESRETEVASVH